VEHRTYHSDNGAGRLGGNLHGSPDLTGARPLRLVKALQGGKAACSPERLRMQDSPMAMRMAREQSPRVRTQTLFVR